MDGYLQHVDEKIDRNSVVSSLPLIIKLQVCHHVYVVTKLIAFFTIKWERCYMKGTQYKKETTFE